MPHSEGVIPQKSVNDYIQLIEIPEELREKIQFYTYSDSQFAFISEISKGNIEKMATYVRELIKKGK